MYVCMRTFTAIWGVDGTVLRAVRDEDRHAAPRSNVSGKWVLVFRNLVLLCAFYSWAHAVYKRFVNSNLFGRRPPRSCTSRAGGETIY